MVYAFELTHIKGHGLSLCKPKHPLVCKCASVQTVIGQQSSTSASAEGGVLDCAAARLRCQHFEPRFP